MELTDNQKEMKFTPITLKAGLQLRNRPQKLMKRECNKLPCCVRKWKK